MRDPARCSPVTRRRKPTVIVLIGVSGCGKSTVGRLLAASLGATFLEGDAYHTAAGIAKMRAGVPLTESDRWPWLAKIAGAIVKHRRNGRVIVVACSALKRSYRGKLDTIARMPLSFIHLALDPHQLAERLRARHGHFMPGSLLDSQLATLEPLDKDEMGTTILMTGTARQTVAAIHRWLVSPIKIRGFNSLQHRCRLAPNQKANKHGALLSRIDCE